MSLRDAWNRWCGAIGRDKAAVRAEEFWQWFGSASGGISAVLNRELNSHGPSPEVAAWIAELNRRTAAYHPDVRAVLGQSSGLHELVLTPDGNPAGAQHVRALAALAPPLSGWTVRTFKPPMSNSVVQVESVTLRPDDVEFAVVDLENPEIGEVTLLLLFVPGLGGIHSARARMAADKLIEAVVGEERCLRWKGRYVMEDRDTPAEKLADIERRPLREITAILDEIDAQLGVSSRN